VAAAVEFTGVHKLYGEVRALDGVDLVIPRGELVALLGPNGAGKSTAVSLMLGLRRPTAGSVRVLGGRPEDAVRQGRVGAMLQTGGLPPGVTVAELLGFVRSLYPRPLPLDHVLELAGCADFARQRVERLSGGQAQRVRFAMALCGDPELLFLDEPTVGLDIDSRRRFWSAIREHGAGRRTVLFATHYLEEADAVADRIVVLHRGRVVADGSAAAIKASAGGRTVRFRCPGADPASLSALPGVRRVEVQGELVRLLTADADATLRAVFHSGLPVTDVETGGADLEEAFLALVGAGDVREEARSG
jgi:ABC-2 type transport system ATP-binding protein